MNSSIETIATKLKYLDVPSHSGCHHRFLSSLAAIKEGKVKNLQLKSVDNMCWCFGMEPYELIKPGSFQKTSTPHSVRRLIALKRRAMETELENVAGWVPTKGQWIKSGILNKQLAEFFFGLRKGSLKSVDRLSKALGMEPFEFLNPYRINFNQKVFKKLKGVIDG